MVVCRDAEGGFMEVHYSSKSNEWSTPSDTFEALNHEFRFTLDPCATKSNAKCSLFYDIEADGLRQDWSKHRVFMNPPYGRQIGLWVKKAYEESTRGALVVCLVPSRTDTQWWHGYCMRGEIRFLRGRLKFGGSKNPAPFPSAVVIFSTAHNKPLQPTQTTARLKETMNQFKREVKYENKSRRSNGRIKTSHEG